jgi:hypothetical protein
MTKENEITLNKPLRATIERINKEATTTNDLLMQQYRLLDTKAKAKVDAVAGKALAKYSEFDKDNIKSMMEMYNFTLDVAVENLEKLRCYGI